MKRFGKVLSIVLAVSMLSTAFAGIAMAATDDEEKDYTIGSAYWDDSTGGLIARWDEPEDKTSYKVQLYRGSTKVGSKESTSAEHYDFTKAIVDKGTGTYFFIVYSSKGGTDTQVNSEGYVVDSDVKSDLANYKKTTTSSASSSSTSGGPGVGSAPSASTGNTGWNQTNGRWWWKNESGSAATSCWKLENSQWYYFGSDAYMCTGWVNVGGVYYYLETAGNATYPQGACYMNTTTPDGYKVDASGAWIQ